MYKYLTTFAIGGLEDIGYLDSSDTLIVLSSQGKGIFDCLTGQKIHRDASEWWQDYDQKNKLMKGFGTAADKLIKVSGLHSERKLPVNTNDDWSLTLTKPKPDDPPFEKYKVQNIFLNHPSLDNAIFITKDGPCELRAFGFSDTGKSFVIALSCE